MADRTGYPVFLCLWSYTRRVEFSIQPRARTEGHHNDGTQTGQLEGPTEVAFGMIIQINEEA